MVLIKAGYLPTDETSRLFPSPCGDYGSYLKEFRDKRGLTQVGFRPLAGIMVLIIKEPILANGWQGFPSPCGDYGSYRYAHMGWYFLRPAWFPSPCGDYGSYPPRRKNHGYIWRYQSFRPLAGIMVLIPNIIKIGNIDSYVRFPSPCGDYGSYPHPL